jgi:hypothetical protein
MICASFVFQQHTTNSDFTDLDDEIMARATANPGFLRKDKWLSHDGKTIKVDYYFNDAASLAEFRKDPVHLQAKRRYQEWYVGYRVEISEITYTHSDGKL